MKIEKVQISELNLEKNLKAAAHKEIRELSSRENINIEKLIPKTPSFEITFELHDVPASIPNAFRRCWIDYIPVNILTFDMYEDFECDDLFLTCDQLNHNMGCIHIDQDEKFDGSISIQNDSPNQLRLITTKDIVFKGRAKIHSDYPIGYLRPKCSLKIKKIYNVVARGCDTGRARGINGAVIYHILDQKPFNQFTGEGTKTVTKLARSFKIGYETRRTADPILWPFEKACDIIINSCDAVKNAILNDDQDKIIVTQIHSTTKYTIYNEYLTITDLLEDYIFAEFKGKIVVISSNKSFEEDIAILKIIHPDHREIIMDACSKIKKDINEIREYVKKNAK